jgi:hypothetical protein
VFTPLPLPVQLPQSAFALFSTDETTEVPLSMPWVAEPPPAIETPSESAPPPAEPPGSKALEPTPEPAAPADRLFAVVREAITSLLKTTMKDSKVAATLDVSSARPMAAATGQRRGD